MLRDEYWSVFSKIWHPCTICAEVFKNVIFEEVNRVLKILYPEVKNKVWEENTYVYDSNLGYECSLEVIDENNKIVVLYGCST